MCSTLGGGRCGFNCLCVQVAAFGKTTLGLTYSLVLGEAVLSPAIPSVAARAGGIFFPLAKVRVLR